MDDYFAHPHDFGDVTLNQIRELIDTHENELNKKYSLYINEGD